MCKTYKENLVDRKFGRLKVIAWDKERSINSKNNYWLCKCICGKKKSISGNLLKSKNTTSCGCRQREIQKRFIWHKYNYEKLFLEV